MKKLIITLILLIPILTFAQSGLSVNIYQDARLAFVGDERGNSALTANIRIRNEWQGTQLKGFYIFVAPEFEYAQLSEDYYRYSANVGFRLNEFSKRFEASASLGYGLIVRESISSKSFSMDGELSYNLNNKFAVLLSSQIVQRTDIGVVRFSGFIGLRYKL